jgi:hypothetical protein
MVRRKQTLLRPILRKRILHKLLHLLLQHPLKMRMVYGITHALVGMPVVVALPDHVENVEQR